MNTIVKEKQVWQSHTNPDCKRIVLKVFSSQEEDNETKDAVLYIEYWEDEDRFHKEHSCQLNRLRSWGELVNLSAPAPLWQRTLNFLVKNRAQLARFQLLDFSSALSDKKLQDEVQQMVSRIQQMEEQLS